ncbi:MAG: hypothetical protein H0T73_22460 [Ardenticatenales bacterium]|nr:hypothetical protein [Ardenticatenales bacterium]
MSESLTATWRGGDELGDEGHDDTVAVRGSFDDSRRWSVARAASRQCCSGYATGR